MKTVRIWLLLFAAMAWTAPLGAEEINAPDAHWHDAATAESSTVKSGRGDGTSESAELSAAATAAQPLAQPVSLLSPEPLKSSGDQKSHRCLSAVVNEASTSSPLSAGDKLKLSACETFAPLHFVTTGLTAAVSQAKDDFPAYGQGMEGYGKRYGAAFGDSGLDTFFGKFLLPSLLHDDPRYFRQGAGDFTSRLLHAATASMVTRRDNGTVRPNYSNMLAGFLAAGIGNLYYPENERGAKTTFERGGRMAASASITAIIHEFWPDIRNKMFKKKQ